MRFQVPQFIEKETAIVGPLTLAQFGWLAIGAMLLFLAYAIFPFFGFVIAVLIIGPLFIALAFWKVGNVPLAVYLARFIGFLINPKQYKYKR